MPLPCKMGPTGNLLEFPYKDHLVAYYQNKNFYVVPGRSIDEALSSYKNTIIAQWDNEEHTGWSSLTFGKSADSYTANIQQHENGLVIRVGDTGYYRPTPARAPFGIVGGSGARCYYSYYPSAWYFLTGGTSWGGAKGVNSASHTKFGCVFDRALSYTEFTKVAKWILATNP